MAHAPLLRNNSAPIFQTMNAIGLSNPASRSSQLSGSTAYTASNSSLNSMATATTVVAPVGPVVATTNIINQKADASRSLYQICVSLRQRLGQVPGFEPYLQELEQDDIQGEEGGPVESLWRLLRTGYPLLTVFNCLQLGDPLNLDDQPNATEAKRSKIAVYKFVQACSKDLKIPSAECFVINDLLGNDTTGFVKVTQVINVVLDLAEKRGVLLQIQPYPEEDMPVPGSQMSYRDHIVKELVDTERKYVQDLENLHDLKKTLEQNGVITGDIVHAIFLNINAILDFQRRFLIRVETTNSMPANRQEWGSPFVTYEDAFGIYQPFIANQRKAAMVAQQNFDKIQLAEHPVAIDFNTLDGFLLKPMQRLVKYPLLLKDLMKKSEDEAVKADLAAGIEAAERVLQNANEAVDRDLLDEAMEDLVGRVDDWKNHRVEQFGRLLLHGVYGVTTGKSEREQDYDIYLFESILLCCKEVAPTKSKDKKDKTRSTGPKIRNKNAKLHLKGRIFMTNVTEVVAFTKPGNYSVQIWWKGDPGIENFSIRFSNEETMRKWDKGLNTQRKTNNQQSATSPDMPIEFPWLRDQASNMQNPYAQEEDDDDDSGQTPTPSAYGAMTPGGTMTRNDSSNNLRNRSATSESTQSLAGIARQPPPPRFPMPMNPPGPLSLQTQLSTPSVPSPGQRGGDSYFSPTGESPASSRTSTISGMFAPPVGYPFPRTVTPQPGWGEDNNRFTAPAMPRAPSRDGPSPVNALGMNGRNPRGPSLPAMPNNQSAAQQQRSRSYSTPDMNNQVGRRGTVDSQIPMMPRIPAQFHPAHDQNIPRSQTGSPRQDLPVRASTQSPGVQRERLAGPQGGIQGGTMAQFPTQPLRQNTPGPTGPGLAPPAAIQAMPVEGRTTSPPLGVGSNPLASPELPVPTQLKVKVNCDNGNYVTLVVAFNITYQSLVDRIDAKLSRFTNSSIGNGNLKLRYRDEDGDYVTIESDDDIQIAFLEWREGVRNMYYGGVGEIELFCVGES